MDEAFRSAFKDLRWAAQINRLQETVDPRYKHLLNLRCLLPFSAPTSIHFGADCIVDTKELAQLALFATKKLRPLQSNEAANHATGKASGVKAPSNKKATAGLGSLAIFAHEGGHSFVRSLRSNGALVSLLQQAYGGYPLSSRPVGMVCPDLVITLVNHNAISDYITLCKFHRWLSVCGGRGGGLVPALCACCEI